jgi:hypothetical protein
MPVLSICWRRPAYRARIVIIIVVYLSAFRLAPHESVALAAGGVLGTLMAGLPARPRRPRRIQVAYQ